MTDLTTILDTPAHNYVSLKAELDQLQREQVNNPDAPELEVQARCRRAVDIIAILRRTNTGPAKATGKRGQAKGEKLKAFHSSLLD